MATSAVRAASMVAPRGTAPVVTGGYRYPPPRRLPIGPKAPGMGAGQAIYPPAEMTTSVDPNTGAVYQIPLRRGGASAPGGAGGGGGGAEVYGGTGGYAGLPTGSPPVGVGGWQPSPPATTPTLVSEMDAARQQDVLQAAIEGRHRGYAAADRLEQQRYLDQLMGRLGLTGGGGGDVAEPSSSAAEDAAFARAKERIGRTTRGAMTAMGSQMAERGITGSGIEGAATRDIINAGAGQLGDTTREQMIQSLERARQVADRNFAARQARRAQYAQLLPSFLQMFNTGATY